jgi:hypothetical protein
MELRSPISTLQTVSVKCFIFTYMVLFHQWFTECGARISSGSPRLLRVGQGDVLCVSV